jgi:large subunit ribosomal protein L28
MSRVCEVTGKSVAVGNRVSHASVSTRGLRTIEKNGIDSVIADLRAKGKKV